MAPSEMTHLHSDMLFPSETGLYQQLVRDTEILAVTVLWTGLGYMAGLLLALVLRVAFDLSMLNEVTLVTCLIGTVAGFQLETGNALDSERMNHV